MNPTETTDSEVVSETVIAQGTCIKGEIVSEAPLRVCGTIEGHIKGANSVEIAPEGTVEGNINSAAVEIYGTVRGNITASKSCRLAPTARLDGELRAASLAICEGASFVGKVAVGPDIQMEAPQTPHNPGPRLVDSDPGANEDHKPTIRVIPQAMPQMLNRGGTRVIKAAQ